MQIKKQGDRAIIDMRNAKKDELRMIAEALLRIGETLSAQGGIIHIRKLQERRVIKA